MLKSGEKGEFQRACDQVLDWFCAETLMLKFKPPDALLRVVLRSMHSQESPERSLSPEKPSENGFE